jgi:hypothetical protein
MSASAAAVFSAQHTLHAASPANHRQGCTSAGGEETRLTPAYQSGCSIAQSPAPGKAHPTSQWWP